MEDQAIVGHNKAPLSPWKLLESRRLVPGLCQESYQWLHIYWKAWLDWLQQQQYVQYELLASRNSTSTLQHLQKTTTLVPETIRYILVLILVWYAHICTM